MKDNPPVIIIGMHRAGTTMITKMLEEAGLFIGEQKKQNFEAIFFQQINKWLLSLSGGSWDHPLPFHLLTQNNQIRKRVDDKLQSILKTHHIVKYLGWKKFITNRSLHNLKIPWGWKDPRNTFTIPLWIDLFPNAKIIHVFRHGVDVANSLKQREIKFLSKKRSKLSLLKTKISSLPVSRIGIDSSPLCIDIKGGFSLWETYTDEATRHCNKYSSRSMAIKYESFLQEPDVFFQKLVSFLELPCSSKVMLKIIEQVKTDRMFAYRNNAALRDFARTVAENLSKYGYNS